MELINLDNIDVRACRVCLNPKFSNGIVLDINSEWLRVFEYCVGLTIDSDEVSRRMCINCARVLTNYAEFKKQCYKSNKVWKSLKLELKYNLGKEIKIEKFSQDIQQPSTSIKDDTLNTETENVDIKIENDDNGNDEYMNIDYPDNHCDEINEVTNKNEEVEQTELTSNNLLQEVDTITKPNVKRKRRKRKIFRKSKLTKPILPKSSVHYCGLCKMQSSDIDVINKHVEEHENNKELNCKLCEYEGRDFADMVSHRYSHYPKNYKISFRCHICNKTCMHVMTLQFHYRSVHLRKSGGWCSVCSKIFTIYKYWRNHEKLHKEDTKKYICDHCGRHYLYRHAIEAHIRDISDEKPHICDMCGKRFKRHRNMMLHISTAHVTEPIKCKHCNKTFKNKVNLDHHMKTVLRNKDYICEVCSRSFPTRSELRNHMKWHADERPYACEVCDTKYKAKSQLIVHMRRHTGILPFKCDYCDRCFATPRQKRVHTSVHTGIRAHKCLHCDRSFHGKKLLLEHCVVKHRETIVISK